MSDHNARYVGVFLEEAVDLLGDHQPAAVAQAPAACLYEVLRFHPGKLVHFRDLLQVVVDVQAHSGDAVLKELQPWRAPCGDSASGAQHPYQG